MNVLAEQAFALLQSAPAVWVAVASTQGSVPREAGTWMAVFAHGVVGTIGGGHVEHEAIARAQRLLRGAAEPDASQPVRYALGPSLGQCCGGVMHLRFERVTAADVPALRGQLALRLAPVALFGGGHVGRALVDVLGRLPFAVHWTDSRDEIFPQEVPPNVTCEHSDPVHAAVRTLAPGSHVLVMSFSHAEDLDIVAACLQRRRTHADLAWVGLIGSRTKWATFRHRLAIRGYTDAEMDSVQCPIGLPGIAGKEPEVIAVAVAAQLLQLRSIHPAAH